MANAVYDDKKQQAAYNAGIKTGRSEERAKTAASANESKIKELEKRVRAALKIERVGDTGVIAVGAGAAAVGGYGGYRLQAYLRTKAVPKVIQNYGGLIGGGTAAAVAFGIDDAYGKAALIGGGAGACAGNLIYNFANGKVA